MIILFIRSKKTVSDTHTIEYAESERDIDMNKNDLKGREPFLKIAE